MSYKTLKNIESKILFYTYLVNGIEYFTSNIDLAHKRADRDTDITITTIYCNN